LSENKGKGKLSVLKAVILAAGLGTRLLPATKRTPKEMLPIFASGRAGKPCLKPVVQVVFEQLYDVGFREFCLVVSRGKQAIKEHFTPDHHFTSYLRERKKLEQANEMDDFHKRIGASDVTFVNQPEQRGTGDAVYRARSFATNESFLLHMGDDLVLSRQNNHLKRLITVFEKRKADAAFLAAEVPDPQMYGVVEGKQIRTGLIQVSNIAFQPKKPFSTLSDVAAYVLKPSIFPEISRIEPIQEGGEISLIPAIQALIEKGGRVYAVKLKPREERIDIGSAERYLETLNATYAHFKGAKQH